MRNDTLVCYACKGAFNAEKKTSASHDGLPVQLCPSCAEKAPGVTPDFE